MAFTKTAALIIAAAFSHASDTERHHLKTTRESAGADKRRRIPTKAEADREAWLLSFTLGPF